MALPRSILVAAALGPITSHASSMNCGTGVPLCGVLTLESGLGSGNYQHKAATVHGLWPQTGNYGSSKCIAPTDKADATKIYECYNNPEGMANPTHQLQFINHEWEKHGFCAGAKNVDDFFGQICSLSAAPVAVIEKAKTANAQFDAMVQAVKDAGYSVFDQDAANDQIELSVCSGPNSGNKWVMSSVTEFQTKCGGEGPSPTPPAPSPAPAPSPPAPSPAPAPSPPAPGPAPSPEQSCAPSTHGPKCSKDGDCTGVSGCVRCAGSGYCTNVPRSKAVADIVV